MPVYNDPNIRNIASYEGLGTLQYEILDRNLISEDYFGIVEFPTKFTAGKNLIKLKAHPFNLVPNSEIYIEILDFNGNPIYYEPLQYIQKDRARVIAIWIYPDTAPGPCQIFLAGRARVNTQTQRSIPFSRNIEDDNHISIPNVLWRRSVPVAPSQKNDTEIIHLGSPKIRIRELVQPYLEPVDLQDVNVQKSGSGTVKLDPLSFSNNSTVTIFNNQEINIFAQGQVGGKSPEALFGNAAPGLSVANASPIIEQVSTTTNLGVSQVSFGGFSSLSGESKLTFTDFPLSESMEGGTITVIEPLIDCDAHPVTIGGNLGDPILPFSQDNVASPDGFTGLVPLSGSYTFLITDVLNTNVCKAQLQSGPLNASDNLGSGDFLIKIKSPGTNDGTSALNKFEPTTNFTSSHVEPLVTVLTEASQSFAEIIVSNLEPATGDVFKMKTQYKPGGQFGEYIDLGDTIIEKTQLLIDTESFESTAQAGTGYNRIGFFTSLADFNAYWDTTNLPVTNNQTLDIAFEPDQLMSGVRIRANNSYNQTTRQYGAIHLKDEYKIDLTEGTSYILTLRAFATDNPGGSTDPDFDLPRLDVYVSGSKIEPEIGLNDYRINLNTNNIAYTDGTNFDDVDGPFGTRVVSYELNPSGSLTAGVQAKFKSLEDADNCDIFFVIRRGDWSLARIELATHIETGFTPNFVRQYVRIPTAFLNTPLAFKFNFFDFRGTIADAEPIAFPVTFTGENTYIDGNGNLITGSVFIGNSIGNGVELAGVNSGFIRSIGYEGFLSASNTDQPGGFLLYTGSILPNKPDNYAGVGLELVEHSESFFRFATANDVSGRPSGLDVRTERFYLGGNNQFISGANGNIEISSSNFHLDKNGSVIMQGTITAEAGGTIGGFTINSDNLSATNFELNTTNNRLTLGSSNNIFIADADEGIFLGNSVFGSAPFSVDLQGNLSASAGNIGGFGIDDHSIFSTGVEINNGNEQIFISSSGFKVDHIGNVTASNVDLSGKITAQEGAIGGFAITSASIAGNGFFISGSASGNNGLDDTNLFISSSKFKVTAEGDITASSANLSGKVTATSGLIGGWSIESSRLLAGDAELDGTNEAIYFTSNTFGNTGIQIEADSGEPRMFIGKSDGEFLKVDTGTGLLEMSGSKFFLGSANSFISGADGNIQIRAGNALISGSSVDIQSPKFFLGSRAQFVSGANGNIEISSSNFHLDASGNVNMSGNITATTGVIGGFTVGADNLTATNFILNTTDKRLSLGSSNDIFIADADDGIQLGNATFADAPFSVDVQGNLSASAGNIAGWNIDAKKLSGTGVHLSASYGVKAFDDTAENDDFVELKYKANDNFGIIGTTGGNTIFSLGKNQITGVADNQIAGWEFDNEKFQGGAMIIRKDGTIESDGFISNQAGSGFRLTAHNGGFLEVENAKIRGTLATTTFEKESVNAVGGQLYVANSSVLTGSGQLDTVTSPDGIHRATDTTMSIENVSGFTADEIITAKKITSTGFATEYMLVQSASRNQPASDTDFSGLLYVIRGYSGSTPIDNTGSLGDLASNAQTYSGSQVLVSTGKIGTGYIRLNANPNDPTTPYIDIVERTGSAIYDIDLKARLGDLSGITDTNFSDDVTGFGLYTQNGYFRGKIEVASLPEAPPSENLIVHIPFDDKVLSGSGEKIIMDFANADINARGPGNLHEHGNYDASRGSAITINSASAVLGGAATSSGATDATGKITYQNTNFGAELTYAGWIKVNDTTGNGSMIFAHDGDQPNKHPDTGATLADGTAGSAPNTAGPDLWFTGNNINWNTGDGSGNPFHTSLGSGVSLVGTELFPPDTWKHFVLVNDKTSLTASLYVDGVKRGEAQYRNPTTTNDDFNLFGYEGNSFKFNLTGSIDEFRIYTGSLTNRQIEALYLSPNAAVGTTKIEGDQITTGQIKSNNFGASAGSIFDLDDGTFKMGGIDNPKLSFDGSTLSVAGTISASDGNIGGVTIGDEKLHVGSGTHGNSNTGFFIDNLGNFSLGDKLVWDGSDLSVQGSLTILAGSTTEVDFGAGAAESASAAQSTANTATGSAASAAVSASAAQTTANEATGSAASAAVSASAAQSTANDATGSAAASAASASAAQATANAAQATASFSETQLFNQWASASLSELSLTGVDGGDGNTANGIFTTPSYWTNGPLTLLGDTGPLSGLFWPTVTTLARVGANETGSILNFQSDVETSGSIRIALFDSDFNQIRIAINSGSTEYEVEYRAHDGDQEISQHGEDGKAGPIFAARTAADAATDLGSFYKISPGLNNFGDTTHTLSDVDSTNAYWEYRIPIKVGENTVHVYTTGTDGGKILRCAVFKDGVLGQTAIDTSIATATSSLSASLSSMISSSFVSNVQSSSLENPTTYTFGGNGFTLGTHTTSTGLNINSDFLGYFDGTTPKTFMSSSGDFFLGGTGGSFIFKEQEGSLLVSGSNVTLFTPSFFFGDPKTNFISGSGSEIEISGSAFHILGGNITASNVDLSGKVIAREGEIGGFIITSASIAGNGFFISGSASGNDGLDDTNLFISSSKFKVTAEGDLTASNVDLSGKITATTGEIGGFTISTNDISATNILIDSSTPKITLGSKSTLTDSNTGLYLGTDGIALGASSVFKVTDAGAITATSGGIAGWSLASTALSKTNSDGGVKIDSGNKRITFRTGSAFLSEILFLGNLGSNKYGIKLLDPENSANTLFKLGEDGNVIQSKTLEAGSGSLLDLDTGVFQIGGTTNPNFRVDNGGDVQSSGSFDIDGFAIARAIRQKVITITQNNKNDFFTTYTENIGSGNNDVARLHLDGSQGGDVAAHVILDLDCFSTSNYNGLQGDVRCIGDIVAPEIPGVGSDDGASSFTIEIAAGRRVELVNTRDFNVTSTSNSKAFLMASTVNATVFEETAALIAGSVSAGSE